MKYAALLAMLVSINGYAQETMIQKVPPNQEKITIELPANRSTGYQWDLIDYNHGILQLLEARYVQGRSNRIGSPGLMRYRFKVHPGDIFPIQTSISLQYSRPWDKNSADKKHLIVQFTNGH